MDSDQKRVELGMPAPDRVLRQQGPNASFKSQAPGLGLPIHVETLFKSLVLLFRIILMLRMAGHLVRLWHTDGIGLQRLTWLMHIIWFGQL